MQRARLIVNPHATTTSPRARDVLTQAVASVVSLEVTETKARGHADERAFDAAGAGVDVALALGGHDLLLARASDQHHRHPRARRFHDGG